MHYGLFLELSRAHCLVVGAGEVGLRKALTLLNCAPASLLVLDVAGFGPAWDSVRHHACLTLEERPFCPADVHGRSLVFACTGSRQTNAAVVAACTKARVLCNCVDAPRDGDFIVPATATASHASGVTLTAALSTGGASPAWARILRQELEEWLEPRLPLSVLLARLRPLVLARGEDTGQNTLLFRSLARSPLREALTQGDKEQCMTLLRELLPEALHPHIPELLYDLI